jgi:hypothetical protein
MTTLRLLPDFEDSLRRIPGVRAVSVVTGADARPTEVHVLSDRAKPPKQVVRDIQSLAMARYDLDIDHRIVSVVQIEDDAVVSAPGAEARETAEERVAESSPRPLVEAVAVRVSGAEAQVSVTLRLGGDVFEGAAAGSSSTVTRPRLVAQATLAALGELLGTPAEVEHAVVVPVGVRHVAVSVVLVQVPRIGDQLLSGSAVVRGDEADAVSRSVLDALNRRLTG